MTTTERILAEMFDKDPNKPESRLDYYPESNQIVVMHSAFHWLADRLIYNESLDKALHAFISMQPNHHSYFRCVNDFAAKHSGFADPPTTNTYNQESLLDTVLQYTILLRDGQRPSDSSYIYDELDIILMIHLGGDVCGHYSIPHVFTAPQVDYYMTDDPRATIICQSNKSHYWSTDDGYHYTPQLETYQLKHTTINGQVVPLCPLCNGILESTQY